MQYFKEKQFKKGIILIAAGYYFRFSLSYRDVFPNEQDFKVLAMFQVL